MSKFTEKWSTGKTLLTRITKQWTQEEFYENDEKESRLVFANFTPEDEGRSRRIIAQCYNKEDALFISKAPEMLELLKYFVDLYLEDHDISMYSKNSELIKAVNLIKEIEG